MKFVTVVHITLCQTEYVFLRLGLMLELVAL